MVCLILKEISPVVPGVAVLVGTAAAGAVGCSAGGMGIGVIDSAGICVAGAGSDSVLVHGATVLVATAAAGACGGSAGGMDVAVVGRFLVPGAAVLVSDAAVRVGSNGCGVFDCNGCGVFD